jgi:hypothetical protein
MAVNLSKAVKGAANGDNGLEASTLERREAAISEPTMVSSHG